MSCARSSSRARVGDLSSGLGSSSSTCSSSTYSLKGELGNGSRTSGGWIEKATGESRAATRGQKQLQKEYVSHLEKDLRQRRKVGRHRSERA